MLKMVNRKKRKKNNNKGFALIEVLVAVAILSIVVLPLTQSFVTSMKVNNKSEVKLSAITVAENKMEQAKALDLSDAIKADDGKYYINDEAEENGNRFNVQTIIDPTKYEDSDNKVYDWSTFSPTIKCELDLPNPLTTNTNGNRTTNYTIYLTISEEDLEDSQIKQTVEYIISDNKGILQTGLLYTYEGTEYDSESNKQGLTNMTINYYGDKEYDNKTKLDSIIVENRDNVKVAINFYKTTTHDEGQDRVYIYEGYYEETDEPYTLIGAHPNSLKVNHLRPKKKHNNKDKSVTYDNIYYSGSSDNSEFSIGYLEVMHAVDVNVYEYIDSEDESAKYNSDLLLTTLQGSKIVD